MGRLRYTCITSLDLFVNDEQGSFEWAAPDQDVHACVNDLERDVGTYLYGRRMYEVMRFWATVADGNADLIGRDYARIWRRADKIVYSRSLHEVATARTRLEETFDLDAVRAFVAANDRDVSVGGPTLAAVALAADLVDDVHLFLHPIVVGGGTRALPDGIRSQLELVDERRFACGVVHLHYQVAR